jgi:hypothetical protein
MLRCSLVLYENNNDLPPRPPAFPPSPRLAPCPYPWPLVDYLVIDIKLRQSLIKIRKMSPLGLQHKCLSLTYVHLSCLPQDKILQSMGRGQEVTVTNDGATILKSVYVDNPAAKVLVGKP